MVYPNQHRNCTSSHPSSHSHLHLLEAQGAITAFTKSLKRGGVWGFGGEEVRVGSFVASWANLGGTMLRIGGRGVSRLLQRAVASSSQSRAQGGHLRVAASTFSSPTWFNTTGPEIVPWLQQRAGISLAGDGTDSHDDFKPVAKDSSSAPSVQEHIEKEIRDNSVMVYMKGVPEAPQCGFSAMVVRILDEYGVEYRTRNVLSDPELRTAIKEYSKWPTIPQVYVNGEFVGGSDILISMHRSGELETLLKDMKKES